MVGLVLVSHSRALAEAACRLAQNVAPKPLPIAFAGGTGDKHRDLGTDATDIMDAIQSVDAGEGVVVLMDLGSAVLSSRMAAELLDGNAGDIRLCSAPLVEGAVAAAAQIGVGAGIDAVCREASRALAAKIGEVDGAPPPSGKETPADETVPPNALRFRFVLDDPHGLHVRPAAALVSAFAGLDAEVRIRNCLAESPFVDARSLNLIALANIGGGTVAELALWGPQAAEAVERVRAMLRTAHPGKEVEAVADAAGVADVSGDAVSRECLSPGAAVGTLFCYDQEREALPAHAVEDPGKELARFEAAVDAVEATLRRRREGAANAETADVLGAHLLILRDAALLDPVRKAVREERRDAASSYQRRIAAMAEKYRRLNSPYLAGRAADVLGVGEQVLDALAGRIQPDTRELADVVLWAKEITPAQIGAWRRDQLAGILTLHGDRLSHAAVLARSLGVPAVAGFRPAPGEGGGDPVAVDAEALEVVVNPDGEKRQAILERRAAWLEAAERDRADGRGGAATRDGVGIGVCANVSYRATAREAFDCGADGIGVLRTEFLYLDKTRPPTEDEQVEALSGIFSIFEGRTITARTLDVGGDKQLPWLGQGREANPFLGVRGVRLTLRRRDFFKGQLRAFLRAGHGHDLEVLLPMISLTEEVDACRALLEECRDELSREGREHVWPVRLGIMLETPASIMLADALAARADFFSAGTNDLTQYVMCAERGNRELASFSDGLHPAVLKMLVMARDAAARRGIPLSVCGEMAGDPVAARVLVGLGVEHFSVNPLAVGRIKRVVRGCDAGRLRALAGEALNLAAAGEVRRLVEEAMASE